MSFQDINIGDTVNLSTRALTTCPFLFGRSLMNIDFEKLYLYKHIVNGWISLFVIIIGMIANTIAIFVFRQTRMRHSSTNLYLFSLSISNLMSLSCSLLTEAIRWSLVYPYFDVYCRHSYERFVSLSMPYLAPLNNFFQLTSIYLIVSASVDRLMMVMKRDQISEKMMKKHRVDSRPIVVAILVFCFVFTLPNWFYLKSIVIKIFFKSDSNLQEMKFADAAHNSTGSSLASLNINDATTKHMQSISYYTVDYTEFGGNPLVLKIENMFRYIPFVFAIPIVVLSVVNVMIIYQLFQISTRRRTSLGIANACVNPRVTIVI